MGCRVAFIVVLTMGFVGSTVAGLVEREEATDIKRSPTSLESEVQTFLNNWSDLVKAGDFEGIQATYTNDCAYVFVDSSVQYAFGQSDTADAYKKMVADNSKIDRVEYTVLKAEEGSGLVYGYGKMTALDSNGSPVFSYKYIRFFKRSDDDNLLGYIDTVWS